MITDVPLFPLGLVLLPGELQPLHIFEPRYRELVARCEAADEPFVIALNDADGLRRVGCTAVITEVLERFPDGRSNILARGVDPIALIEVHDVRAYRTADVQLLVDVPAEAPPALQERALEAYAALLTDTPGRTKPEPPATGPRLSYALAGRIEFEADVKQELLEERDEARRLLTVARLIEQVHRGFRIAGEVQRRAMANGRVRTPEEIAAFLGL
jgi:Lon protease-like protein